MLTVAQAMRAANFTDEESKNRTMQMQVRRALEKKRGGTVNNANPFLTPPVGVGTSVTAISSLTTTSASSSGGGEKDGVLFPQPALKRIRRTASAMQQDRINTLQKGNHFKEALKRATLEYSSESKKRDGKSAAKIAAEIKLQHDGVGPDARMITRYVNEYNHVGMSPIKTGVKSNIPHWAFLSLCTAAELDILIRYHGAVSKGGKQEKTAKWKAICDKGKKPAGCLPWTEPEEAALVKLQTEEITMGDTHLGRQEETMKRELLITGANMTVTEWSAFCEQRQRKINGRNQPPTAGGIGSTGEVLYEEGSA
jgi:hypothetical protein